MAVGAFTNRPLPLPLRWQRAETQGHDDASVIGSIDVLRIDNEAGHVWGEGELFDDISPATNPKLAEDVNEVKYLLDKKTIGPSVDPGSAHAVAVIAGTDEPLTEQKVFELMLAGATELPPQEMLFTSYEIAGATLVPVPAFAECRPFELVASMSADVTDVMPALVAAAMVGMPPEALFEDPKLDRLTNLTRRELPSGWVHVFGHIAEHATCLVGRRDVCITPPYSEREYSSFHRYHQSLDGDVRFPLPLGRLTAGFGSLENTCRCCPGNDDHACANISFGAAVAHHDQMQVLAYGRVGEDEANNAVWFSGFEVPGIDARGRALLRRQKISGDWRGVAGSMELSEVLVLNRRTPGFPLPRVSMEGGRQRALTAAGILRVPMDTQQVTVPAEMDVANVPLDGVDYARLGAAVADALMSAAMSPGSGELAFNPKQLRDDEGKWAEGGGVDLPEGDGTGGGSGGGHRAARNDYNKQIQTLAEEANGEVDDDDFDEEIDNLVTDLDDAIQDGDDETADQLADVLAGLIRNDWNVRDRVPAAPGVTAAAAEGGHSGAMLALRMTDEDAARLCVHDGLPMDELHSTLAYLGEAAQISPEVRDQMVKDVTKMAQGMQPFQAEAADVTVFNPGTNNDREPALVLGLTGGPLADLHQEVSAMGWDGYEMPQQFSPYKPHITLRQPAGDIGRAGAVVDRMGPVTFDRMRLAFGDEVIDIPLGPQELPGGPIIGGQGLDISGMSIRARAAAAHLQAVGALSKLKTTV